VRLIPKDDLLRFSINNSGILFLDEKKIDLQDAESRIKMAISFQPNLAVLLLIDPNTKWQNVVSFVELAQKLKVESFSFRMNEKEESI
jgi:biopolymer transport protein ExbD